MKINPLFMFYANRNSRFTLSIIGLPKGQNPNRGGKNVNFLHAGPTRDPLRQQIGAQDRNLTLCCRDAQPLILLFTIPAGIHERARCLPEAFSGSFSCRLVIKVSSDNLWESGHEMRRNKKNIPATTSHPSGRHAAISQRTLTSGSLIHVKALALISQSTSRTSTRSAGQNRPGGWKIDGVVHPEKQMHSGQQTHPHFPGVLGRAQHLENCSISSKTDSVTESARTCNRLETCKAAHKGSVCLWENKKQKQK